MSSLNKLSSWKEIGNHSNKISEKSRSRSFSRIENLLNLSLSSMKISFKDFSWKFHHSLFHNVSQEDQNVKVLSIT